MEGEAEGDANQDAQGASGQDSRSGKQGGSKSKSARAERGQRQFAAPAARIRALVSKLRDAMSNLLSRMKQQPNSAGAQQQASNQNAQQWQGQKGSGQKAKSGQGKQQQGGQDSDSQDGDQGEEAENAQNAQGRGAGQSSDDQASKQPGSGIGKQDGNKDVKLAEQTAAMGKISEIIGKRSANVSGEVTVEVQNRTSSSRRRGSSRTPLTPTRAARSTATRCRWNSKPTYSSISSRSASSSPAPNRRRSRSPAWTRLLSA